MHLKSFFKPAIAVIGLFLLTDSYGQYSITGDATTTIEFSGFTGAGLTPGASTAGSLDSDMWGVDLDDDGTMDSDFGDSNTGTPYAGGTSASQYNLNPWPPGQIRAFTHDVTRLGVRLGNSAGTTAAAGHQGDISLILRIQNNTGGEITSLDVAHSLQSYISNGTTANVEFYHSSDNTSYTQITGMTGSFDNAKNWGDAAINLNTSFSVSIANNAFYYIKWVFKDHDGNSAGIGIVDIDIKATIAAGEGEGTITAGTTNFGNLTSTVVADPGEDVFDFTITDDASTGSDAFPIQFSDVTFTAGASDGIDDWRDVLAGARLEDTDGNAINASSIGTNSIVFSGIPTTSTDLGYVPDDGSETYTLSVWFNTSISEDIDGDLLHIDLSGADFTFTGATSTISATESASSNTSYNDIEVTATTWGFRNTPTVVGLDENFTLEVGAVDAYGNIDADDNTSTFIISRGTTGSGNLTEGGSAKTALSAKTLTNGKYTYTDIQYDASESFDIDVDDSGGTFYTSATSSSILAAVSYQSIASGSWSDFATVWQYWDGTAWATPATYPSSTDGVIYIRNGTDVSVDVDVSVDQVIIENGGEISMDQNNDNLTIADGPDADLVIENGGILSFSNYNALPTFTGTVEVQAGGTFSCSTNRLNEIGTSTQIDWQTDAVFLYTSGNAFSYNTAYFPGVADGVYPIVETTGFTTAGNGLWSLNAILKVSSATLAITGTGVTIRDGILADGDVTLGNQIDFTGSTLHFGGTGSIDLDGESYAWSDKTIEMEADQEIFNGSIALSGSTTFNGYEFSLNDGTNNNLDLSISNGATINSNATGGVASTLAADGTVTIGNSLDYNFAGASTQTLGFGTIGVTNTGDVTVNNSNGVSLDSDITIDGRLTLTSGVFATTSSSEVLTISGSGSIIGASSTNYIDGPLEIQDLNGSYTYHVSDGTNYRPALITTSTSSNITVEAIYSTPPNNTSVGTGLSTSMANLYWDIQRGSGTGSVTAQLYYKETTSTTTPDNDLIADGTHLRLIQYDGSTWQSLGLDANNSDVANLSSITGTISSFIGTNDYYTIGSQSGSTVLPVEYLDFTVEDFDGSTILEWSTATEIDNERFEIEYSTNGIDFTKIDEIEGSGTVDEPRYYSFVHSSPAYGSNYYRLKQIDFDGAFEYSETVWIEMNDQSSGNSLRILGNPVQDKQLKFVYESSLDPVVRIIGIDGRIISEEVISNSNSYEIDLTNLPSGTYMLNVNGIRNQRFVID